MLLPAVTGYPHSTSMTSCMAGGLLGRQSCKLSIFDKAISISNLGGVVDTFDSTRSSTLLGVPVELSLDCPVSWIRLHPRIYFELIAKAKTAQLTDCKEKG